MLSVYFDYRSTLAHDSIKASSTTARETSAAATTTLIDDQDSNPAFTITAPRSPKITAMPPQDSSFLHHHQQQQQQQQQQQHQQNRQQANDHFVEMSSAIDELRRQLSDVQTEMQRQTALYDLERMQLQKERRQMHEERLRMANLLGDKLKSATETEQAVRARMQSLQQTMQMIREKSSTLLACSQANTMALRDITVEASRRYEDQQVMASYYEDRQRIEDEAADEAARAFEETLQINEQHDSAGSSTNPFDPRNNQEYSDIPEYCNIQEMQQFWDERHRLATASATASSSSSSLKNTNTTEQQQQQQKKKQQQDNDNARWDLSDVDSTEYMKSSTSFVMESYPPVVMKLQSFAEEVEKLVDTPKSSRDIHFYRKLKSKNRQMRMTYRVFAENLKRYGSPEDIDAFRELDEKSIDVLERANKELEDLKKIKMYRYTFNVERTKQAGTEENK